MRLNLNELKLGNWTKEIDSLLLEGTDRGSSIAGLDRKFSNFPVSHLSPKSFAGGNTRHLNVWVHFVQLHLLNSWVEVSKSLTFMRLPERGI